MAVSTWVWFHSCMNPLMILLVSNLNEWLGADRTSVHTEVKPYSCTNCHKIFSRVFKVQVHERVNIGEKTSTLALSAPNYSLRLLTNKNIRGFIEEWNHTSVLIATSHSLIIGIYRDIREFIEDKNHCFGAQWLYMI